MRIPEKRKAVEVIAVIGATKIGQAITLTSILAGFRTVLEDVSPHSVDRAKRRIQQQLQERASGEALRSLLSTSSRIEDAIRDADLIIEAVPDELEMKLELFTIFDKFAKPGAIFASTTATFTVGDITDVTILRERCIGIHLIDGVPGRTVLEVVAAPLTSGETTEACMQVARRLASKVILRYE